MTSPNDQAFPGIERIEIKDETLEKFLAHILPAGGLTKREYFAAMAMQGICAGRDEAGQLIEHGYEWIVRESVKIADALIAELSK